MHGYHDYSKEEYEFKLEHWDNRHARKMLKTVIPGQRDFDINAANVYDIVFKEGRWHPGIGAPMGFNSKGQMVNGGHRTLMISRLPDGVKVPVLVFRNMPDWSVEHYDNGKQRKIGDFLRYAFPEQKTYVCVRAGSIAGVCMAYAGPPHLPRLDKKWRPEEVVKWAIRNEDALMQATYEAMRIKDIEKGKCASIMTTRSLGFILYYLPESADFFAGLASRHYQGNDPRQKMTDFYYRHPFPPGSFGRQVTMQRIGDLLSCWDAYKRGTKWKRWNTMPESFRHPHADHGKAA